MPTPSQMASDAARISEVGRLSAEWFASESPVICLPTGRAAVRRRFVYADLREAISMEKRYFTTDLSSLS